jgi:hypothetical protein
MLLPPINLWLRTYAAPILQLDLGADEVRSCLIIPLKIGRIAGLI